MLGTPPTPETSVSLFVWTCMLLTGLTVVLTLMVVRRRRRTLVTVALSLGTMVLLGSTGLFLIVPPRVPSAEQPGTLTACPYDRLVWSNMRADVADGWRPCRTTARFQLALTLLGASGVTVAGAASATRRTSAAVH